MSLQHAQHPARAWSQAASIVVVGGFAGRWALLAAVEAAILSTNLEILPRSVVEHSQLRLRDYAPWESFWVYAAALTLSAAVTGLMVFAARRAWATCPRSAVGGGAVGFVVLLAMLTANFQRHTPYFARQNSNEITPATFPFSANTIYTRAHNDHVTHAVIGPDGRRRCTDQPRHGDRTHVTMVGDSFVFGLYVGEADSPCWMLQRALEDQHSGAYAIHNTAKPGASIHTYAEMMQFTMEHHGTDAFIVGMVIPNDAEPIGPLSYHWIPRSRIYQALSSLLHPETVLAAMLWHQKVARSEGFEYVSLVAGLRRLSKLARRFERPTMIYVYDNPGQNHARAGAYAAHLTEARRLATLNPFLHVAGVFSTPIGAPEATYHIVGDGHPNEVGHAHYHSQLYPEVLRFFEEYDL